MTTLLLGDCLAKLSEMPDCSVDAIVTDPPYGLSFMGKKWDYDVPSVEVWAECLRVLKPGGHLLAFAGTRTQHRMAVRIEDAGFEIRDMIAWVYGSGFPKSLDVSKAIDKAAGAERVVVGRWKPTGTARPAKNGSHSCAKTTADCGYDPDTDAMVSVTAPATPEAQQWSGWGTALKPALEPITVARKPLSERTVAANVLTHGTGGINVDGCRVEAGDINALQKNWDRVQSSSQGIASTGLKAIDLSDRAPSGRWPANLVHDGSDEVMELFPADVKGSKGSGLTETKARSWKNTSTAGINRVGHDDTGSAARFFYCAKASRRERNAGLDMLQCISIQIRDQWGSEVHKVRLQVDMAQSRPRVTGGSDTAADTEWSTVLFGNSTTGPFPMGCKCITRMATSSTTLLETLNYSARLSTSENIADVNCAMESSTSHVANVESASRWKLSFTSEREACLPGVGIVASQTQWTISDEGERPGNFHPTCKPIALMRYLCRLVTPPGGVVLDPFMGSGSTGIAASQEGFNFIGIELDPDYFAIAEQRIQDQASPDGGAD